MIFLGKKESAASEQERALAHYTAKVEKCVPSLKACLDRWRNEEEDIRVRNFTFERGPLSPHKTRYADLMQQANFRQQLVDASGRIFARHGLEMEAVIVSKRALYLDNHRDPIGPGYELRAKSKTLPQNLQDKYATVKSTALCASSPAQLAAEQQVPAAQVTDLAEDAPLTPAQAQQTMCAYLPPQMTGLSDDDLNLLGGNAR